ncbi:MAG TPA: PLP-dependent aminotransferase family protein [Thermoanaerobaculia bacterium]|nr:PLP-dependent aminotransferase family protein [Thermoanaerobaculia bacterium]
MKLSGGAFLGAITLDPRAGEPLHRQLYEALRRAIVSRQLRSGTRLPSTRSLAADLGVSRNTVLAAFEQLTCEGYLAARPGVGTRVAATIPDELLAVHRRPALMPRARPPRRAEATPAVAINSGRIRAFEPALPALDLFPVKLWARLVARQWSGSSVTSALAYGDPAGHQRLREAVAQYVGAARGVVCDAEQVVITNGTLHALELSARVLVDPGDAVWFEEPGYPYARLMLSAAGARVIAVPVDREGLSIEAGLARAPSPRLIYVTPSHQFPLGVTMSAARRMQLLEVARRAEAWIFEDDYDCECRHAGLPLPAIRSLDTTGRVLYAGSFSKALFPSLRLGYLVLPPALVEPYLRSRALSGRASRGVDQAVVAEFILGGHLDRHLRRMRVAYRERQEALLAAAARHLAGLVRIERGDAGLHAIGWLAGIDDAAASRAAAEQNIEAPPLSAFCAEDRLPGALVLGYGAVTPRQIFTAAERLARALEPLAR